MKTKAARKANTSRGAGHHGAARLGFALAAALVVSLFARQGAAQDQVRDFEKKAILVFNPGGHHAPVRALVYTPDGKQLLSGGADKVVHVWDVQGARPALMSTIRPPIWRGPAGMINAMALSPVADANGQRILAIAGFGVLSRRGNVGLYRFPGSNEIKTGDHFDELVRDDPDDPQSLGHGNVVTSLAFSTQGTLLVSGSNDGTARVWDVGRRRSMAVLTMPVAGGNGGVPQAPAAVNAVAFTSDGEHVLTAGSDGVVRLWDIRRPAQPIDQASEPARNAADPLGVQINAMTISGDDGWVVAGREDGVVVRYSVENGKLTNRTILSANDEAIEALALNHDHTRLAITSIGRLRNRSELPRLNCKVQVITLPGGAPPQNPLTLDNIAYACAFSPDDGTLAVAGGDRQAITLLRGLGGVPDASLVLQGQGRSVWDVGLRVDQAGLSVGFSHDVNRNAYYPPVGTRVGAGSYRGFVLPRREISEIDPATLDRAILSYDGWTIQPVDPFHLDVTRVNPPARTFRITLSPATDRRWKCYSFIPPGPGHPGGAVAVGCEAGVWFYRLEDGQPTRLYAGHSGPVYCLAPSKDGRWLATGSSDQTVRLWTLSGCDRLPKLGAEFERRGDGSVVVKAVAPRGFAEAMGLQPGDAAREFKIAGKGVTTEDFLARFDTLVPNTGIEILVRRNGDAPNQPNAEEFWVGTTERDSPALSLFLGEDEEWVVWMPSGYYDTSIAGDTRFLGWQFNHSPIPQPKASDFLEIIKFEKQLRQPKRSQPNKLDTLLQTADLGAALAVPFPPLQFVVAPMAPPPPPSPPDVYVSRARPPTIAAQVKPRAAQRVVNRTGQPVNAQSAVPPTIVTDGAVDGSGTTLDLGYTVQADGDRPLRSLSVQVDGRALQAINQPVALRQEAIQVALGPGLHRVVAEVENDLGIRRSVTTDVQVTGPARPQPARLKVLSIVPEYEDPTVPPIKFAQRDVDGLRRFFRRYLVSPARGTALYPVDDDPMDGKLATTARVGKAFASLSSEVLTEADLVVVVVESHFLNRDGRRVIASADGKGVPPEPSIDAAAIAQALGSVAKQKCKVVVFLDGVHTASNKVWDSDVNEWVRHLRDEQNVITFIASSGRPSQHVTSEGHRALAQAILDSIKPPIVKDEAYTLDELRDKVVDGVLAITNRQQRAACYVPETLSGQFPIVNPRPDKR